MKIVVAILISIISLIWFYAYKIETLNNRSNSIDIVDDNITIDDDNYTEIVDTSFTYSDRDTDKETDRESKRQIKKNTSSISRIKTHQNIHTIYRCDGRRYCSQMTSCDEAKFFLRNCPNPKMDGDGDGIPCERQWCNNRFR